MTWNIEWFPKNDQITVDYVTEIIQQLDLDLFVDAGYKYNYWFSANKKGYSGVAIFTKEKPEKSLIRKNEFIIPLAALVGAPLCEKNKKEAISINLNSIKLLMKCKQKGSLSEISEQLGNIVRTNSESILGVKFPNKEQKELLEKFREIENEKSNPSIKKFFQKAKSFWKN